MGCGHRCVRCWQNRQLHANKLKQSDKKAERWSKQQHEEIGVTCVECGQTEELRQRWKGNMPKTSEKLAAKAMRLADTKGADAHIVGTLKQSAQKAKWREQRIVDRGRRAKFSCSLQGF